MGRWVVRRVKKERKYHFFWCAVTRVLLLLAVIIGIHYSTASAALAVTIDFETAPGPDGVPGTPDDVPLTEGVFISDQYASLGVQFYLVGLDDPTTKKSPYIATAGLPAVAFVSGTASESTADQPTASGVNALTDGFPGASEFVPGASNDSAEYGVQFSSPMSMVGLVLIDFGDCITAGAVGDPMTASLVAYDAAGNVVDTDSFTIEKFPGNAPLDGNKARLVVRAPGIMKVETAGVAADCGTAVDDLTFFVDPPEVIDFETAPGPDGVPGTQDDVPLTEGVFISDQYASLEAQFYLVGLDESPYIATAGLPAVAFVSGTASESTADQPTASGVNTLTDGFPGASEFVSGASNDSAEYGVQFSSPMSMVGLVLIDFGDCITEGAEGDPVTASLVAYDAAGAVLDTDSFTIEKFPGNAPLDGNHARLVVRASGIVRVETGGVSSDCGTAIDDVIFVPEKVIVSIDIKPGSDPNCFNNNGQGVIPVAVLGGWDFNVRDIDASSVKLKSLPVKIVGKSNALLAHYEDVNLDGYEDLVVQIEDNDKAFSEGESSATLTGKLHDGVPIEGEDAICIVP